MNKTATLNALANSKAPIPQWQLQEMLETQHHEQMQLLQETQNQMTRLNRRLDGMAGVTERLLQTANRLEQSPDSIKAATKTIPKPLRPVQVAIICMLTALITASATAAWVNHTVSRPVLVIDTATLTRQLAAELKRP